MKSTDLPDKTIPLGTSVPGDPLGFAPTIAIRDENAGADTKSIDTLPTGAVLGRYVILTHIGDGGMGVVYAAYDPELDRKIALKLLRDIGDAAGYEQARARMLREAQAMARLSHPNVIAVHDVGIVNGRVFIAMEFVEGVTLRTWLEKEKRSLEEIIGMFTQAGKGLAAAHSQGIVHRDFKPDNVLVGIDGRARVLDFGLAHGDASGNVAPLFDRASITGNDLPLVLPDNAITRPISNALDAKLTQVGVVMGTPAYMSAEQFTGKPTDARTDQFSFCVALYEAVYGELPYGAENLRELARVVYHGIMRPEPSGRRIPKKLRQALLRGLGPKKETRFASMDALLGAIQIEPARNRWVGIALILALVASVATAGYMSKTRQSPAAACYTSRDKLAGIWDDERKRVISEAFSATDKPYAKDSFAGVERTLNDYADKWITMRTDACLATRERGEQSEELFDLRMQCLNHKLTELRAFTDVLAKGGAETVEKSVAGSQSFVGLSACADAEALRAVIPPPKNDATLSKVQALREQLAQAQALDLAGRYKEELAIAEKAAADVGQIKYRPIEGEVYFVLARTQRRLTQSREAEIPAMNAIFAAEASRHDRLAIETWTLLTMWKAYLEGPEIEDGRVCAGHARALLERIGDQGVLLGNLEIAEGNLEYESGKYDRAREHYQAALTIYERTLGPEHSEVANALQDLAGVARYQGRHDEALKYSRRALALLEKNLGVNHPHVSRALTTIGLTLEARGELAEARKVHERALSITEKVYGPDHNNTATALTNLANTLGSDGQSNDAIALYTRALAIQEKNYGVGHVKTSNILQNIGAALTDKGQFQEAVTYFERSIAITEKAKGPDYVELCLPLSNLATSYTELKRYDDALQLFQRALQIAKKTHGEKHPYIADALEGIGIIHSERRQFAKAIPMLEEALTMRLAIDEDPLLIAEARFELGRALWESGKDKPRGLDLVKEAHKASVDIGDRAKKTTSNIDTWLRSHSLH